MRVINKATVKKDLLCIQYFQDRKNPLCNKNIEQEIPHTEIL